MHDDLGVTFIQLDYPCNPDFFSRIEYLGRKGKAPEVTREDHSAEVTLTRVTKVEEYVSLIRLVSPDNGSFNRLVQPNILSSVYV